MQTRSGGTLLLLALTVAFTLMPMASAQLGDTPLDQIAPADQVAAIVEDVTGFVPVEESSDASSAEPEPEPAEEDDAVEQTLDEITTIVDETAHDAVDALLPEDDTTTDDEAPPAEDDAPSTPMSTEVETMGDSVDSGLITAGLFAAVAIGAVAAAKQGAWLRFITLPLATLFSRFQRSDILDHPRRAELHGLICQAPGISVPDLAAASGLSRNTVLHHLRMLEREHIIVSQHIGRTVHWYENGGRYGRERKEAYAILQDDRSRDVARFIVARPGSTQREVAEALGLAPSVVTWHMQRLERAELVRRHRAGRTMQCFPLDTLPSLEL